MPLKQVDSIGDLITDANALGHETERSLIVAYLRVRAAEATQARNWTEAWGLRAASDDIAAGYHVGQGGSEHAERSATRSEATSGHEPAASGRGDSMKNTGEGIA